MKKFLKNILGIFTITAVCVMLAPDVSAQNLYLTKFPSQLARFTLNESNGGQNTNLRFARVQTGYTLERGPVTTTDSAVFRMDTSYCALGVLKGTTPFAKTAYLHLDSASTLNVTTSFIQTCPINRFVGRVSTPLATNAASTGSLSVGAARSVQITGTTTINLIDTTGFVAGDMVTLAFNGSLTVTDSSANSGVYSTINLSTGSNLSATKNDILTLMLRKDIGASAIRSEWWEVARTVNAD